MRRLTIPRWPFVLAVALGLTLLGPVSLAEEDKEQAEETRPAAEPAAEVEATPAPELRVEQGRILTNRGGAAQPAAPNEKVQIDQGLVITNAVLDRLFGPSPESPTASEEPVSQAPASQPADPLKVMRDEQATAVQSERMIAEAQAELDAAKAKLANLEVELLATRNPFSKRPELSDEEKEYRRTSGETAAERNARVQKLVDEARVEVQAAEEKLDQLRSGS